jgi:hypothetical protein
MKKMTRWMIASLVAVGLTAGSIALADRGRGQGDGWERGKGREGYRSEQRWDGPRQRGHQFDGMQSNMRALFQEDMDQNRAEVLSELSGKPAEEIRTMLQTRSMGAVVAELGLTQEQIQPPLHAKMVMSVYKAQEEGRITQDEAERMYAMMSAGPRGPRHHDDDSRRGRGYRMQAPPEAPAPEAN